jgi:hypothetical protein
MSHNRFVYHAVIPRTKFFRRNSFQIRHLQTFVRIDLYHTPPRVHIFLDCPEYANYRDED